jgi:hypothetical protein
MKLTGCRSFATEQADSLAQRLLAEFPSSRFASVLWGRKILTHGNPAPFPLFVYKIKWRDKKGNYSAPLKLSQQLGDSSVFQRRVHFVFKKWAGLPIDLL